MFPAAMFPAALLGAALFASVLSPLFPTLFVTEAWAQSGADAGAPEQPAAPPPAAAEANAAEPEAPDPGKGAPFVPKTLRDGQRLPDNLQGWLHERGASRPRLARNAASASALAPHEQPPSGIDESARAVRSRRMRSFDEAGITVLSNRLSQSPAALARVASARVAEPAPRPRLPEPIEIEPELEQEPSQVTETRSLRAARAPAQRSTFDDGFGWASLAAGGSALGLAALWFRRRSRPQRS